MGILPTMESNPTSSGKSDDRLLGMLADNRNGLGRGDVVARSPIVLPSGSVEVFLDDLLPPRESVSSAHGKIMAERGITGTKLCCRFSLRVICTEKLPKDE